MLDEIKKELLKYSSKEKAIIYARFFKTKKGQYGYGDVFLGLSVPQTRLVALKYFDLIIEHAQELILSKIHEERLAALFILVEKYRKSDSKNKKIIVDFYLKNTKNVNNWNLVDLSADKILGNYLLDKDKSALYKLAKSDNLWERRIAIVSSFEFIRNHKFDDTIKISEILLNDKHDLIQKAVGWMLREMGKKDEKELIRFLGKHYKKMPRTMLRYAIERLDEKRRKFYMKK